MSNDTTDHLGREEIEKMLPFYVTGQLDQPDAERIADYLRRHPDVASQLDLVRAERESAVVTNSVFANRPVPSFERVAAMISTAQATTEAATPAAATPARPTRPALAGPGALAWIRRLFDTSSSPALVWAGAAAALVILLQAAAIATLVASLYSGSLRVAHGPGTSEAGTSVLVHFADNAPTSAVADALTGLGVTIVDGPIGGRMFKVRLGPKDMAAGERDRLITALKARSDLVTFVTLMAP